MPASIKQAQPCEGNDGKIPKIGHALLTWKARDKLGAREGWLRWTASNTAGRQTGSNLSGSCYGTRLGSDYAVSGYPQQKPEGLWKCQSHLVVRGGQVTLTEEEVTVVY